MAIKEPGEVEMWMEEGRERQNVTRGIVCKARYCKSELFARRV